MDAAQRTYYAKNRWSLSVWIITTLGWCALIALLVADAVLLFGSAHLWRILPLMVVTVVFIAALLVAEAYSALGLEVSSRQIVILRRVSPVVISREDILSITPFRFSLRRIPVRLFSTGGVYGMNGKYYIAGIGWSDVCITSTRDVFLVRTPEKNYLLNCTEPSLLGGSV